MNIKWCLIIFANYYFFKFKNESVLYSPFRHLKFYSVESLTLVSVAIILTRTLK